MELTAHKKESNVAGTPPVTETISSINTRLPKVHVTNVSASFAAKLAQCKTTPVPALGTYHIPYPGTKLVHIIQDIDSTLKIISVQHKPSNDLGNPCINLHNMIFPNYSNKGDPGEGKVCPVNIHYIKVNGEEKPDIHKQTVYVHDGCFSPELSKLADRLESGPVTVSAVIALPQLAREHLYHGVSKIKMLNVLLPRAVPSKSTRTSGSSSSRRRGSSVVHLWRSHHYLLYSKVNHLKMMAIAIGLPYWIPAFARMTSRRYRLILMGQPCAFAC